MTTLKYLFVTENYSGGGLEQFLDVLSSELLKLGHEVHLAVGLFSPRDSIKNEFSKIHTGFFFGENYSMSVQGFIDDVDRLSQIIYDNQIDIVYAHPFFSLFSAVAAAKMTGTPIALQLHGKTSLSFPNSILVEALTKICINESADHVFYVSDILECAMGSTSGSRSLLRNPARCKKLDHVNYNKNWVLASRLDDDKAKGIIRFLEWLPDVDIDGVDVFGEGNALEEIKQRISELGLGGTVSLHGYNTKWMDYALKNARGVIGFGRVAIEALSCGLPVIHLSPNGTPCGIVDKDLYAIAKNTNFAGTKTASLRSVNDLENQISKLYANPTDFNFSSEMKGAFSVEAVCAEFVSISSALSCSPLPAWERLVDALRWVGSKDTALFLHSVIPFEVWDCFRFECIQAPARLALTTMNTIGPNTEALQFASNQIALLSHQVQTQQDYLDKGSKLLQDSKDEILALNNSVYACSERVKLLEQGDTHCAAEVQRIEKRMIKNLADIKRIKASNSWRIGRTVTYPLRKLKSCLRKFRSKEKGDL